MGSTHGSQEDSPVAKRRRRRKPASAAPPDAAGHAGTDTRPSDVLEPAGDGMDVEQGEPPVHFHSANPDDLLERTARGSNRAALWPVVVLVVVLVLLLIAWMFQL